MKKGAICPGSFDPLTKGHIDIITRAAKIFDEVVVLVMTNGKKKPTFDWEERIKLAKDALEHLPNITVDYSEGLVSEYGKDKGISVLIKGLRSSVDFEYEMRQGFLNKRLNPNLETVYFHTSAEYMQISSSMIKEVCGLGGDISSFVSEKNIKDIEKKIKGSF